MLRRMLTAFAVITLGCDSPPVDRNADGGYPNHNAPVGRIEGTVVYQGPPPAVDPDTRRPLGRVVLLLFSVDHLPPPEGLATTAVSVQTIPASQMFVGATVLSDGTVRTSVSFVFPGISQAGVYQLRAFYSHVESTPPSPSTGLSYPSGFNPLFSVRDQPVQGDIGGGAVDLTTPLQPFVPIAVGTLGVSADGGVAYTLPEGGSVTRGVTVFLGTPIVTDRPVFSLPVSTPPTAATALVRFTDVSPTPATVGSLGMLTPAAHVLTLPANVPVDEIPGNPAVALPSFPLQAGLLNDAERDAALMAGVVVSPIGPTGIPVPQPGRYFLETAYDADHNGVIDWSLTDPGDNSDAHPTLVTAGTPSHRFPWIYPLVVLSRLHDPTAAEQSVLAHPTVDPMATSGVITAINSIETGTVDTSNPAAPRIIPPVVIFGSVVPGGDPVTGLLMHTPPWNVPGALSLESTLRVVVPPVAFEVHGPNPATDWVAVFPPLGPGLLTTVGAVLGGPQPPIGHFRCDPMGLPPGRYAVSLITQYGQGWTTPNELTPLVVPQPNPTVPSQGLIVRIAPPDPGVTGTVCPTPSSR